jgi:2-iminobutanoate/2-iminopropanoate deaminase
MHDRSRSRPWPLFVVAVLAACAAPERRPTRHLEAEGALGPYSAAVVAGDIAFVAGKIGDRSADFAHEAETAIDAVEKELARLALDLSDVVAATVYLTDMDRYPEINEIYGRRFPAPYPARACVAVKTLPGGAKVEIQVTARLRD